MESGLRKLRVRLREREDWMVERRARLAFSASRASRSAIMPEKGIGGGSMSSAVGNCLLENLELALAEFQFWWREVEEKRVWQARTGWAR